MESGAEIDAKATLAPHPVAQGRTLQERWLYAA